MPQVKDLTGRTFGRLTVVGRAPNSIPTATKPNGLTQWFCRCECGVEKIFVGENLTKTRRGTRSCGCLKIELVRERFTTHGHTAGGSASRAYSEWSGIKARTGNANNKDYDSYGGRGIRLHPAWIESFEEFQAYISGLDGFGEDRRTLDRINNDGNYEPGNLRWATPRQQIHNRRTEKLSSQYPGVHASRTNRWQARITIDGKRRSLGYFDKELDAANAYQVAFMALNE